MAKGGNHPPSRALKRMNTSRKTRRITVTGGPGSERQRASRRSTVSRIARDAAKLGSVYEAEYFVSSLLGQFWERRACAPPLEGFDQDLVLGAALAQDLAANGGRGSRLVLQTIGRLARGGLGALAADLAREMDDELPAWAADLGRSRATSAVCASAPGDGVSIVLEVAGAGMVDHAIALFIDERRGGIAKHLGLIYGEADRPGGLVSELGGGPADIRDAARQVLDAIRITDGRPDAPVGETFATLRMIAIARAASALPGPSPVPWAN